MLLDMTRIFHDAGFRPKGVIQVGAHIGQEVDLFVSLGIQKGVFFEPLPTVIEELRQEVARLMPGGEVVHCALGETDGTVTMSVEDHPKNRGMSSSCLRPALHTTMSPEIIFSRELEVPLHRMDGFFGPDGYQPEDYDLLCMDVQGYEDRVLRGAESLLPNFRCIFTEINTEELYEGCARLGDLDAYLRKHGFERALTHMAHQWWGDACYMRAA